MATYGKSPYVGAGKFSVRGFRPHRQWAVDCDYLHRLPPEERAWMQRFLAERYDADNKLLRPQQHYAKCPDCRVGGDCGRRPPPIPVHDSDDMRRECYRLQKSAYEDVYSRGSVTLWEDYEGVDSGGAVAPNARGRGRRVAEMRPRVEAGDYADAESAPGPQPVALAPQRRRK